MSQLLASMSGVVLGGVVEVAGSNLARGEILTASIGSVDLLNEPWHEISNNFVCATSKASDQPAHTRCLIRGFACHLNIL